MSELKKGQFKLDMASITEHTIKENVQAVIRLTGYRLALKDPAPYRVRSRHEAYGVAAENYTHVAEALKQVKKGAETLLSTLGDINRPALKAVNSLCDTSFETAVAALVMAAEMQRTLSDLNAVENLSAQNPLDNSPPMDTNSGEGETDE